MCKELGQFYLICLKTIHDRCFGTLSYQLSAHKPYYCSVIKSYRVVIVTSQSQIVGPLCPSPAIAYSSELQLSY